MKFSHVQKVHLKFRTGHAGLFSTMTSHWWRCILDIFIMDFELGLWIQRDDVHHLFKGGKSIKSNLWRYPMTNIRWKEILHILIILSVYWGLLQQQHLHGSLCFGWVRKKCLASLSFCNWIQADSRLEQQWVPRGRLINRGTRPVCWRYLCRNQ